jgi:hypothetical protein
MNLKNISRDSFWIKSMAQADRIGFSTDNVNITFNSSGTVNAVSEGIVTVGNSSGSNKRGVGIMMDPPTEEIVPYRVKVRTGEAAQLAIGYAPVTPSGTDDLITEPLVIKFSGYLDEIFMIPYNSSYPGRALVFAIIAEAQTLYYCGMSVQKLDVVPNQFGLAVP